MSDFSKKRDTQRFYVPSDYTMLLAEKVKKEKPDSALHEVAALLVVDNDVQKQTMKDHGQDMLDVKRRLETLEKNNLVRVALGLLKTAIFALLGICGLEIARHYVQRMLP